MHRFLVRVSGRTAYDEAFDSEWQVFEETTLFRKLTATLESWLRVGGGAKQMLFGIAVCGLVVLNKQTNILLELSLEFSSRETFVVQRSWL